MANYYVNNRARSAYSKPGGASPLCYKTDVSDDMVRSWRRRNGQ